MLVRSFNQEEKDISAYLCDTQKTGVGMVAYDYHEFYIASSNNMEDVFLCVEMGKYCIQCENNLQEFQSDRQGK